MDKEKVIKGLETCIKNIDRECPIGCTYHEICTKYEGSAVFQPVLRDTLDMLKKQEWHMLTEDRDGIIHGLPGDDGRYLMTDGKDIWIDDYVDGVEDGIFLDSGRYIREITAWMYMPELPKKERS